MFDYPLPIPRYTLYQELGLAPEATLDEIRDALSERRQELRAELARVSERLSPVYSRVSDLKEAEDQVAALRLENPNLSQEERETKRRAAGDRLDQAERQALASEPEFKRLRERAEELKHKEEELNTLPLATPPRRLDYDREHPPLELFKLADCKRNDLFDRNRNGIALAVLRRELSAFLAAQGEAVFHPSDLTREDFSADYSYTPLLDGER